MRLLSKTHDGGADSGVTAYFLIEWKSVFSIALLRFENGTRDAFHEHAFNAVTLWLKGRVREHHVCGCCAKDFAAGDVKITLRKDFHKVEALGAVWALTLRGPWVKTWREYRNGRLVTLTHGRREVS